MSRKHGIIFKEKIRRAFMLYSLIPILISVILINILVIVISIKVAKESTYESSKTISLQIEDYFLDYIEKGQEFRNSPEIQTAIANRRFETIYPEMYMFMNNNEFKGNFYIYDEEAKLLTGSKLIVPGYLENIGDPFSWGIFKQMKDDFGRTVMQKNMSVTKSGQTTVYSIGNAIIEEESIIGYIVFDINEDSFKNNLMNNPGTIIAVTDGYNNVIYSTNSLLVQRNGKLKQEIRKIASGNEKSSEYTVYTSEIFDGKLLVYSIAVRENLYATLRITNIIGVIMFLIIFFSMTIISEIIANTNSEGLTELTKAFQRLKMGDFESKIDLGSTMEFKSISQVYNDTLEDIKRLIAENEERAARNVMSELETLEAQFNPHFLFNTLETIRYTIDNDSKAAKNIIKLLSNILRYSINKDYQTVMIGQDLEFIKCYLQIQRCRFKERFQYIIDIEEEAESCVIPKLIIQPLIENAIKYGFVGKEKLLVEISGRVIQENIIIIIKDNGIGINDSKLTELKEIINRETNTSTHIGLHNVQRRIKLTYGMNYGITIDSKFGVGTTLKIRIPTRYF